MWTGRRKWGRRLCAAEAVSQLCPRVGAWAGQSDSCGPLFFSPLVPSFFAGAGADVTVELHAPGLNTRHILAIFYPPLN